MANSSSRISGAYLCHRHIHHLLQYSSVDQFYAGAFWVPTSDQSSVWRSSFYSARCWCFDVIRINPLAHFLILRDLYHFSSFDGYHAHFFDLFVQFHFSNWLLCRNWTFLFSHFTRLMNFHYHFSCSFYGSFIFLFHSFIIPSSWHNPTHICLYRSLIYCLAQSQSVCCYVAGSTDRVLRCSCQPHLAMILKTHLSEHQADYPHFCRMSHFAAQLDFWCFSLRSALETT